MADIQQFIGAGVKSTMETTLTYALWGVIISVVIYFGYRFYMDKKVYKNPVRVFRQRQNGTKKEFNTKGGYIKDKLGIVSFWIKIGRFKRYKMPTLPDPDAIDEEDRVYYHQISPVDYVQTKAEFNYEDTFVENKDFVEPSFEEASRIIESWTKQIIERDKNKDPADAKEEAFELYTQWLDQHRGEWVNYGKVVYNPLSQPSKESMINDMIAAKGVLGVDANKQFLYFIVGAIVIFAMGAIVFYIASNEGRMPFLEFAPLLYNPFKKSKFK